MDLTAADVIVNMTPQDVDFLQFNKVVFPTITFGGVGKTYGEGHGIPLPALDHFGLHKEIKRGRATPNGDGYVYVIDRVNHKLRIFQSAGFTPAGTVAAPTFTGAPVTPTFTGSELAAHNHDLKVMGGATGGPDETMGVEGGDTLAKEAANDRTIAGVDSATKGGVVGGSAGTPAGAISEITPAGTCSAPAFTGAAVAAAGLVEVGASFAPLATTLELELIGQ